ncbi:MAG: tripartite tricarboxylate transporter substrate binding protein [Betaproteobacteria bacterium]|nr:tripartite tricarboxylate transporter substrate binding protein [Betaproteobacteria bacterium]
MSPENRNPDTLATLAFIAIAVAWPQWAPAQTYPNKPIRLVVPFTPGGSNDIIARILGQKMSESLNQPVIIDNRPGAAGTIGVDSVVKSAPDGYTLIIGSLGPIAIHVSAYPRRAFDPVKNLAPITQIATGPLVVAVNSSLPVRSVKELIEYARPRPGQLNFSSTGKGSTLHLSVELLKLIAKIDLVHVPYKGGGQAVNALVANEVQVHLNDMAPLMPFVKSGAVRALAVTSGQRSSLVPDLPTIAESGVSGYDATSWYGIFGPGELPRDIVTKLNAEIAKLLRSPDIKERFNGLGIEPVSSSPEEFAKYIRAEIDKWAIVVKASGAEAE